MALNIAFAHCNFKLREEASDEDERFVKTLAKTLSLEAHTTSFETKRYAKANKLSIQMAARELRYEWFQHIQDKYQYDYVLTAHHLNDSIETFLIHLSRGTGLKGLTGIPAQNNSVVRVLLPFSRDLIIQYAEAQKIQWREDQSNAETKYLRNKIRHEIVPILHEITPTFYEAFATTNKHLNDSQLFINTAIKKLYAEVVVRENGNLKFHIGRLKTWQPLSVCLFELFKEFGFSAWEDIEQLLEAQAGKYVISNSHRLIKDREYLLLEVLHEATNDTEYYVHESQKRISSPLVLVQQIVPSMTEVHANIIYVDKSLLKFPLILRKWRKGDYFYPLGMQGKKKLSKFFKDEKFSLPAKEAQWLLCSEEQIVWVVGHRADARFKISKATKTIQQITYIASGNN
jgi:tRNA(Ile)-lysidine synthase